MSSPPPQPMKPNAAVNALNRITLNILFIAKSSSRKKVFAAEGSQHVATLSGPKPYHVQPRAARLQCRSIFHERGHALLACGGRARAHCTHAMEGLRAGKA
jgi:hypothetical protein